METMTQYYCFPKFLHTFASRFSTKFTLDFNHDFKVRVLYWVLDIGECLWNVNQEVPQKATWGSIHTFKEKYTTKSWRVTTWTGLLTCITGSLQNSPKCLLLKWAKRNCDYAVSCAVVKADMLPKLSEAIKWTKLLIQRDYFMARLRIKHGVIIILL